MADKLGSIYVLSAIHRTDQTKEGACLEQYKEI